MKRRCTRSPPPRVPDMVWIRVYDDAGGHTNVLMPEHTAHMTQGELVAQLLLAGGNYIFCLGEPRFTDHSGYDETYDTVGPDLAIQDIIKLGAEEHPEDLTIHLVPDTANVLAELVCESADFSAWCDTCSARVTTDDGDCACYKCGSTLICFACLQYSPSGGEDHCEHCLM